LNIVKSIGFIGEKGTNMEKARINCILYGINPTQDVVQRLNQLQNEDGGFTQKTTHSLWDAWRS
jgi:hypothetical protein